jgi:hypothetical protein
MHACAIWQARAMTMQLAATRPPRPSDPLHSTHSLPSLLLGTQTPAIESMITL